ncbi:hypothetical protein BC008_20375 [Mastigocoleus testarum BC008]|uniref:Uncharacterized protein n=1 Tax=Mastigocoleus testarum BC008 TaxID=371196 RepID=A0A0V7ZLK0_9CYAN|nr:hypothetical protein BC008_20375 [Mastigocoleus testarum BC008]
MGEVGSKQWKQESAYHRRSLSGKAEVRRQKAEGLEPAASAEASAVELLATAGSKGLRPPPKFPFWWLAIGSGSVSAA